MSVHTGHRGEDRLMEDIQGALQNKNYAGDAQNTHTLRELLMLSSVDMETSNGTSITALCTIDSSPAETLRSFERLLSFTREKDHTHKAEVSQILFPVFVHFYLDLLSSSQTDTALTLFSRHKDSVRSGHGSELKELSELTSPHHLHASPLVNKFRKQKFSLRMSSAAFHLLMQFLQVCETPVLFNTVERYLTIEVYGSTPMVTEVKQDSKKSSASPSFIKPRLPQLTPDDIARNKSRRASATGGSFTLTSGAEDGIRPCPLPPTQSVAIPTNATPPAELAEYKERLSVAAAASQLVPTLPSVSLHTVTSDHPHAHCATFNSINSLFCFGFSDSSLRLWPELPLATDHMTSHDQPEMTTAHQNLPNSTIPPLLGHRGPVYGTSFNSKGSFLLSSSEDCTVRLWDVDKRSCVVCYHGHQYPVWNVTFSPVDVYFISCSHDMTARLWTCDLAYPLRIFAGHTAGVNVAEFHPNGKYVATGSSEHTCRLWDIHSGHCVRLFTGKKGSVCSLVFLPNGKQILTSGNLHALCILYVILYKYFSF
ncbi:Transcription initiation factor TFIID subunit 5 [Geodia barretti]|uniref:Transcription initiation factor TFIID subunit 5 n=1 Tax=Geodia barretti TaxID=519541 RepID=A0AA35SI56_GEOBA|nr:Transcription initiation factor TFIID subunit 5 [Geodia barretti]